MIRFVLPRTAVASLEVFDISGRLVRTLATGARAAGSQAVRWDGTDGGGRPVGAGVYLLRLETMGARLERRVIRIR